MFPSHVPTADWFVALAFAYLDLGDRENAVSCLLRALGLKPDHADGHLALGQVLLAAGEYGPGWLEYEWRNQTEAGKGTLPKITSAAWNGMTIPNGRLLVVGDQGYGDTIQFARYIPMIASRCKELILGCSKEMGPLFSKLPGVQSYCHQWSEVPGHAAHCRLSTAPGLFQTTLETIPARASYLFADPERAAVWRDKLNDRLLPGAYRVGLAWTGRPTHPNDRRRSMALDRLAPLADSGRISFVSLQKPIPQRDLASLALFSGMTDISDELTDFGETAAVVANLDLVITVDTAVAHLAGALGKPVWIMLPKVCDWRWMEDRSDSPWYPTARLFRQQRLGEWDAVISRVASDLFSVTSKSRTLISRVFRR